MSPPTLCSTCRRPLPRGLDRSICFSCMPADESERSRVENQLLVLYYPPGETKFEDGTRKSNQLIAQEVLERLEQGGVLALPHTRDPYTGQRMWEAIPRGLLVHLDGEPEVTYRITSANGETRTITGADVSVVLQSGDKLETLIAEADEPHTTEAH